MTLQTLHAHGFKGRLQLVMNGTRVETLFLVLQDIKGQTEVMSWLMFQMGGLGPMQGQVGFPF